MHKRPTKPMRFALLLLAPVVITLGCRLSTAESHAEAACPTAGARTVIVASPETLRRALNCAKGDTTIALRPGQYGRLEINGRTGITLRSESAAAHASFDQIKVVNSKRIDLAQLRLEGDKAGVQFRLMVSGSTDVKAAELDLPGNGADFDLPVVGAVFVDGSQRVTLERLRISRMQFGISFRNVDGLTIAACRISGMRTDGIRGMGTSNLAIVGNRIDSFRYAEGDHPDGIQLWTANQKASARNVRISENLILRGEGKPSQGVFIGNEDPHWGYENLMITDNVIVGTLWNGIAAGNAVDVRIRGNFVAGLPGQASWIVMRGTANGLVDDNRVSELRLTRDLRMYRNRTGAIKQREIDQAIASWTETHSVPDPLP
jgi:polygalacturonase